MQDEEVAQPTNTNIENIAAEPTPANVEPTSTPAAAPAPKQTEQPAGEDRQTVKMPEEAYFNGTPVEVEVPSELQEALEGAGADVSKIVHELFSKDSNWELSAEARAPLDAKFGRGIVDSYLAAIKVQNENVVMQNQKEQEAKEAAEAELAEWSNELVGGEEAWNALDDWASQSLDDTEISNFNAAMQSGNKYIQELAIKQVTERWKEAVGDTNYALVTAGANAEDEDTGGAMTAEQYIEGIKNLGKLPRAERQEAEAKLDARRRAGIAKGI